MKWGKRIAPVVRAVVLLGLPFGTALAADEPGKAPVPTAEAQQEALALIKEIYGEERIRAETDKQMRTLAKKFLKEASETQDDLTSTYVLLKVAKDIAVEGGDGWSAFQAIDQLDQTFQIDAVRMKANVLNLLSKKTRVTADRKAVVEQAHALIDGAIVRDDFKMAEQLIDMAIPLAQKARDAALVKRTTARKKEIEGIKKAFAEAKVAEKKLETNPKDPDANLIVGKYQCIVKGAWETGLPMLSLGSDPALQSLAAKELGEVTKPAEERLLGDDWWSLAEKDNGAKKERYQERAAYWYRKALPATTGLVKKRIELRLKEMVPTLSSISSTNINPTDWKVRCWNRIDRRWVPFPLEKMANRFDQKALYVRNTTGIHSHAYFFYGATVFDGDFRIAAEVRGDIREIGLYHAKGENQNVHFYPSPDDNWHTFTMQRKSGTLTMRWDGWPVTPAYWKAEGGITGEFAITVSSGKECAIRKLVYEKK